MVVDKFGRLWEGRYGGLASTVIGAHAGGFNTGTFGVSMLGNYDIAPPPQVMLDAVADIIAWKFSLYGVDPRGTTQLTSGGGGTAKYAAGVVVTLPTVFAHRDVGNTACPGQYAYSRMDDIRSRVAAQVDLHMTAIERRYAADAGLRTALGAEKSDERYGDGYAWREYERGRLYWSATTGVKFIRGDILTAYLAAGGPAVLGAPATDEGLAGQWGAFNHFAKDASIYWTGRHRRAARARRGAGRVARDERPSGGWASPPAPRPLWPAWRGGEAGVHRRDRVLVGRDRRPCAARRHRHGVGRGRWRDDAGPAHDGRGECPRRRGDPGLLPRLHGDVDDGGRHPARGRGDPRRVAGPRRGARGPGHAQDRRGGDAGHRRPVQRVHRRHGRVDAVGRGCRVHRADRDALDGGGRGRLLAGAAAEAPKATSDGRGQVVRFSSGASILQTTGATQAFLVRGGVGDRWTVLGGVSGLGLPVTDETNLGTGAGVYQVFARGKIFWSPSTGAQPVYGAIGAAYDALGAEFSRLGLPTRAEYNVPGGTRADFQHGELLVELHHWRDHGHLPVSGGARHRAPGRGFGRRLAAVVAALVFGTSVLATLVVGSSSADAATDRAVVPVGGEVPLLGHGFGHGRGLSQYGAYGAATTGASSAQILDFYYAGTTSVKRSARRAST